MESLRSLSRHLRPVLQLLPKLLKASPGMYPGSQFKEKVNRAKFIIRGLDAARNTEALFESLEDLFVSFPRLAGKLQWPYLTSGYSKKDVLNALKAHYEFFRSQLPEPIRCSIANGEGYPIACLRLEDAEYMQVMLRPSPYEKEGELALSLQLGADQATVCTASFTISQSNLHSREIIVGGLQGHHFRDEKPRIIALTRAMKGMRPKALLLFVLQQISLAWGVVSLKAVGNAVHIYSSARRRKELAADYDLFWIESGGALGESGLFSLPVLPPVRDISEIKANKRSTYRQRYALLDALALEIRAAASGAKMKKEGDERHGGVQNLEVPTGQAH